MKKSTDSFFVAVYGSYYKTVSITYNMHNRSLRQWLLFWKKHKLVTRFIYT